MWIEILCIEYILKNTQNQIYIWCCKYAKNFIVKNVPINIYELYNMQACSFRVWVHPPMHPNSSGKVIVLASSQLSTRV